MGSEEGQRAELPEGPLKIQKLMSAAFCSCGDITCPHFNRGRIADGRIREVRRLGVHKKYIAVERKVFSESDG